MRFFKQRTHLLGPPVLGVVAGFFGLAVIAFGFDLRASARRSDALTVVTRQGEGHVTFEAYENIGTLWSTPGAARAISTLLVTIRRDQTGATALWQVETVSPQRTPITYGRVPEGFVQMIPRAGAAPTLRADEEYSVSVLGPGGTGHARFHLRTSPPADR
jgi:hypothetical protein